MKKLVAGILAITLVVMMGSVRVKAGYAVISMV